LRRLSSAFCDFLVGFLDILAALELRETRLGLRTRGALGFDDGLVARQRNARVFLLLFVVFVFLLVLLLRIGFRLRVRFSLRFRIGVRVGLWPSSLPRASSPRR
jgi:hypothetical protein